MAVTWNIRVTDRRGRARIHSLGDLPLVLGRDETLPIPLDDPQASRQHCRIDAGDEDSFRLQDLNSTNGTFLNGRKIARGVIGDGDRIKIGETILELSRADKVAVEDDTGTRRLSILKSFAGVSPKARAESKSDEKSAVLSRLGAAAGSTTTAPQGNQRLTLVAEIAHLLTGLRDRDEMLKLILSGLIEVYPIDRVAVLLRDEKRGSLEPACSKSKAGAIAGVVVSRTICQHVLRTGEAIITENALADPRFSSGDSIIEHRVGSVIAAPITARETLLGVLYACTSERAARFSDHDLSFLALIGSLVALTVILEQGGKMNDEKMMNDE